MTYKIKTHYGSGYWWSIITTEIPTKEDLKEELIEYYRGSNMYREDVEDILAVIEQCKIPQTFGIEHCDAGFIVVTNMEWDG